MPIKRKMMMIVFIAGVCSENVSMKHTRRKVMGRPIGEIVMDLFPEDIMEDDE